MKKGALSSTFERDVYPIRQITLMGSLRKPLEGRSEAQVFSGAQCAPSLAATLRNPFLLDFRGGFLKKSGHEARFLLVTPDRIAIPYSQ